MPTHTSLGQSSPEPRPALFAAPSLSSRSRSSRAQLATILLCLYQFTLIVVLLNMLITLMGDIYQKVVRKEKHVFLQGRAELIVEVETTMNQGDAQGVPPPFLHLLRPVAKGPRSDDAGGLLDQARLTGLAADAAGGDAARKGGGDSDGANDGGGGGGGGTGDGAASPAPGRETMASAADRRESMAGPLRRQTTLAPSALRGAKRSATLRRQSVSACWSTRPASK